MTRCNKNYHYNYLACWLPVYIKKPAIEIAGFFIFAFKPKKLFLLPFNTGCYSVQPTGKQVIVYCKHTGSPGLWKTRMAFPNRVL